MKNTTGMLYKLNWDNEFSVRFNFNSKEATITHIPNNIFSVELPEVNVDEYMNNEITSVMKLVLRSTVDGSVEKELFDTLLRNMFDIEISLSNPNRANWRYSGCVVDKISFSPLIDRKSKSNPFNYTVYIKPSQITYNGETEVIKFGKDVAYPEDVEHILISKTSPELTDLTQDEFVEKEK